MLTNRNWAAALVSTAGSAVGVAGVIMIAGMLITAGGRPAAATPKFQQETGRECAFCHTKAPQLTERDKAPQILTERGKCFKATRVFCP